MNDVAQLFFATGILINALMSGLTWFSTRRNAKTVALLEQNTNSMKDALVKITGEAEYAKGVIQGRGEKQ